MTGRLRRYDVVHHPVARRRTNQLREGVCLLLVHSGVRRACDRHQHLLLSGGGADTQCRTDQQTVFKPTSVEPESNSHGARCYLRLRRLLAAILALPGLNHTSRSHNLLKVHFTARRCASAVLAVGMCPSVCLSVCPSVRPSVTRRYCIKTAKRRITQATSHDSSFPLPKISAKFERYHPNGGTKRGWGRLKWGDF